MREIILASQSQGRKEVLEKYTKFKVVPSNIYENKDYKDIKILTMALSFEKRHKYKQKLCRFYNYFSRYDG
ncbi:Maf family protein [Peptoniphilus sp. oral taxon 836]|uniref:Maf family protein n=1 Tax=Peptoniphilus sp. oral taxon 836 TaxID=671216 RepID=UPI00030F48E8|nr:Maf family protein [Peptoniphilus sp. oral taxon 836]